MNDVNLRSFKHTASVIYKDSSNSELRIVSQITYPHDDL